MTKQNEDSWSVAFRLNIYIKRRALIVCIESASNDRARLRVKKRDDLVWISNTSKSLTNVVLERLVDVILVSLLIKMLVKDKKIIDEFIKMTVWNETTRADAYYLIKLAFWLMDLASDVSLWDGRPCGPRWSRPCRSLKRPPETATAVYSSDKKPPPFTAVTNSHGLFTAKRTELCECVGKVEQL